MTETGSATSAYDQRFAQGVGHFEAARWGDAEGVYRDMLVRWPSHPDVLYNLAIALDKQHKLGEAREYYCRVVALRPDFFAAWNNLGVVLYKGNQPAEAVEAYRRSLTARKDFVPAWNNLGVALKDTGGIDKALACFDRSIQLQPNDAAVESGRAYMLTFHPSCDDAAVLQAARRWNDRFAKPLAAEISPHDNDPSPERRLRVGYLSPDFREHCTSVFTAPLLAGHNHQDFEVFCYSAVAAPDALTAKLRRHADVWRDIAPLSDHAAAELIRRDRIDILVDLTLHMAGNRLGVLARKPAPVQVTWLGYIGTTGLDAMDYRLTDPRLDPLPGGDDGQPQALSGADDGVGLGLPQYSERSVYLPESYWCYDPRVMGLPPGLELPVPGALPALTAGHVTFGCLNNFCKVTDPTLELWARVLAGVPNSRLIMAAPPGAHRQRVVQKLRVAGERVQFVAFQPRWQYFATHQQIDVCLDPFPYNGGTTSLDALWMGVPVLTRVGRRAVGRAGLSLLHNLDLTELAAPTDEEYIKKAVEWSGDLGRLSGLRASLRQRMERSALMDGPRFARNMENAYRRMWRGWTATQSRGAYPPRS